MEAFPMKDFVELGLTRYYPRIYRGLPRLYRKDNIAQSRIKKAFTHLPTLKKQAANRAVFSLYSTFPVNGKIGIISEPDCFKALDAQRVLKNRFLNAEVCLISSESSDFDVTFQMPILGLHFLEKGILTRKLKPAIWSQVRNEDLNAWRNPDFLFYLADLTSPIGGAIYLHALLKSLENDEKGVDICSPDLSWFIQYLEIQQKTGRSVIEWELGVKTIEVQFENSSHVIQIAPVGKKVRLLSPRNIDANDLQTLLSLSGEFTAVSTEQSLIEAISIGKPFFYDGQMHNFIRDLLALAENRIKEHPDALTCIRGINQSVLYSLPIQSAEWVDETFFHERDGWTSIALSIGLSLQDPNIALGFKTLSQIIAAEFSANTFLCHLVQRAFCHLQYPSLKDLEASELEIFGANVQTFTDLIQHLRDGYGFVSTSG